MSFNKRSKVGPVAMRVFAGAADLAKMAPNPLTPMPLTPLNNNNPLLAPVRTRTADEVWLEKEPFEPIDIFTASSIGDLDAVKAFIYRGIDLNGTNKYGVTALLYASYLGHQHIVKYLLDSGASPEVCNRKLQTPLMLAASCGHIATSKILLQNQSRLDTVDMNGWDALFYAASGSHTSIVEYLLKCGADPNSADILGYTPFLLACKEGLELVAQTCLRFGVDLDRCTKKGQSGRQLARAGGHEGIVSIIDNPRFNSKKGFSSSSRQDKLFVTRPNKPGPLHMPQSVPQTHIAPPSPRLAPPVSPQPPSLSPGPAGLSNVSGISVGFSQSKRMPESMEGLLEQMCLQKYLPHFVEQEITLDIFWTLKDEDLKRIGIKLLGPRKKLCNAIARYHDQGPVFTDMTEATYADHKRNKAEEAENRAHQLNCEMSEASSKLESANVLNQSLTNTVAVTREAMLKCRGMVVECKNQTQAIQEELSKDEPCMDVIQKNSTAIVSTCSLVQSLIDHITL